MPSKTRINDFIQRWRLVIPDERLFTEFRTRVNRVISHFHSEVIKVGSYLIPGELEEKFAEINGSKYAAKTRSFEGRTIQTFISNAPGFLDLVLILQRLFWAIENVRIPVGNKPAWDNATDLLISELNTAIGMSAGINLRRIEVVNGAIELYPEGIKLLDDAVDDNAVWLKPYPDVAIEFHKALSIAVSKDSLMYRQALDSLRYALEKLLKIVLHNNASIEKQKDELQRWMKQKKIHSQIRQNYTTLLAQFSLYQNTAVKHDHEPDPDEIRTYSESELEYMIYLTSTLIRFLLQTNRSSVQ